MELGRPAQRVEQVAAPLPDGRRRSQSTELITRPVKIMCESGEEGREGASFLPSASFFPSLPPCKIAFQPPTFISRLFDLEYCAALGAQMRERHDCKTLQFTLRWFTPFLSAYVQSFHFRRSNAAVQCNLRPQLD